MQTNLYWLSVMSVLGMIHEEIVTMSTTMTSKFALLAQQVESVRSAAVSANDRVSATLSAVKTAQDAAQSQIADLKQQLETLRSTPEDTTDQEAALDKMISSMQEVHDTLDGIDKTPPAAVPTVDVPPASATDTSATATNTAAASGAVQTTTNQADGSATSSGAAVPNSNPPADENGEAVSGTGSAVVAGNAPGTTPL